MDVLAKLEILTDAAKYDAACTSSGVRRGFRQGYIGNTTSSIAGCCHTFSADGRCVTLLKVLMSNCCVYDCAYCVNRRSNDTRRAAFTPQELADLTINFYRRNYIEGLFLSSGVLLNPDYTMEQMIRAIRILREEYRFNGYIHAKAIPGAAPELVEQLGLLADRLSCNIELPSEAGLRTLAPEKTKAAVLAPMRQIQVRSIQNKEELVKYRHTPKFAPAGQSTQMIVGATPDSDLHILRLTQGLYDRYQLKRVFFSAYVPVVENALLPSKETKPPLLREHRLYQADWLLRFYGFRAEELLDEQTPSFDPRLDPKCCWALRHPDFFPRRGEPGGLRSTAARPRSGGSIRPPHPDCPAIRPPAAGKSAEIRCGHEAGAVFPHRQWPHGRRSALHTRQPSAKPHRRGAVPAAPAGDATAFSVRRCRLSPEVPYERNDLHL